MISTALGFGGRIGRMRYIALSTGLAFAMTALTLALVFMLAPASPGQETGGEPPDALIAKVSIIVLPIFFWGAAALAAKRFRDIGWKPLYVIPGWALAIVLDTVIAVSLPKMAIGDGGQTALGLTINLVMFGALLFWPGRELNDFGSDTAALRQPYLGGEARAQFELRSAPAPGALPGASGFGRRRA